MTKKAQDAYQKGVVAVEDHQDRLRLRWTHAGNRYCLALGLPNSKVNLKAAKRNPVLENADYSIPVPTEHQTIPQRDRTDAYYIKVIEGWNPIVKLELNAPYRGRIGGC
ncbi:hypothetical protein [Fischerella thermalis]|uniref:hypothetical protein n=1 Tax=Fischerella thermalis TaxID=372787 RepID=UPI002155A430|nr:hypothetical protein [Fischerella thermalis]